MERQHRDPGTMRAALDFGDEPRTLDLGPAAVRVLATTGAARSGAPVTIGAREATIFAVGRG